MTKQVVMIIAFDGFRDEEYQEPKLILEANGIKVITASSKLGTATGKLGMKTKVDITLEQIKVSDYNAVLFIGGPGSYAYHQDQKAHQIIKEAVAEVKVIGGICAGVGTLAYAGILKGKKATCFSGISNIIKEQGAHYTGNGVEVDGNIVTADGPESATNFGKAILTKLR